MAKTTTTDKYESMTVVELKEILRERGLPVSGSKAELIARLEESSGISLAWLLFWLFLIWGLIEARWGIIDIPEDKDSHWYLNIGLGIFVLWFYVLATDPPYVHSEEPQRNSGRSRRWTPGILKTVVGGTIGGLIGGPFGMAAGAAIANDPSVEWDESQNDDS